MAASSEFSVRSSTGSYDVRIGAGQFRDAVASAALVVVDEALVDRVPATGVPVLAVPAGEETKTLAGCENLILRMRDAGVRRGDHVVAVGGGVIQDLATFVTDVYMRGLPWSYVPTTLMAMADSCIGGKSSINVGDVKNLVGGIYPPTAVVVDPEFLTTLSPTARAAGFSEAAKISFCRGPEAFEGYLAAYERFGSEPEALIDLVLRSKRWFVEIDEHDRKERRLLNFGHTFGHALEVAVDHEISHGLGVAVGVLCATQHPSAGTGPQIEQLAAHCRALLASADGVGEALARFDPERYERAFRADKKHGADGFHLILPAEGGGVKEVRTGSTAQDWDLVLALTEQTIMSLKGPTA